MSFTRFERAWAACATLGLLATGCRSQAAETPTIGSPTPGVAVTQAAIADAPPPTPDYSSIIDPATDSVPKRLWTSPPQSPPWLPALAAQQEYEARELAARHDFKFANRQPESGITFRHGVTGDGAVDFKPNHYDHGNGVAAADVDGDGLTDVYFLSQLGPKELWRNKGDGTFENITDRAGVAFEDKVGVAASFADLDNDGDQDLYVTSVRYGNELFANDGTGTFTDVTAASGLGYIGHSSAVDYFDYDNDGLLDVFLSNVGKFTTEQVVEAPAYPYESPPGKLYPYYVGTQDAFFAHVQPGMNDVSKLYRNLGDLKFEDVTDSTGLVTEAWSGDAIPVDANEDGWTDVFVLDMQGHDQYFENQAGKSFVNKSLDRFPRTSFGSMGATVLDFDNDSHQDLYVTDMHSDMSEDASPVRDNLKARMQWGEEITRSEGRSIWGNSFFHNRGAGAFDEESDALGLENLWPWGVSAGDLNADGFQDLFVTTSMNFAFRYLPNTVLLNDGGDGFKRTEFVLGVEPRLGGVTFKPWYNVDCGARPDHMLCAGTGATGVINVWEPLGSRGSVIFDVEGDGDLDVVTNDWNSTPQVLLSDLGAKDGVNWITVELEGTSANRDGLGAAVMVQAGDLTQTQANDGQSGYLTQSALPLYFGLGSHTAADSVTVTWPGGVKEVLTGPFETGTKLHVTQGQGVTATE